MASSDIISLGLRLILLSLLLLHVADAQDEGDGGLEIGGGGGEEGGNEATFDA